MSLFHPCDITATSVKVLPAAVSALTISTSCEGITRFPALSICTSKIGMLMAPISCCSNRLDRAHQIDQPTTLKITVSAEIGGRGEKQVLHLLRISNVFPADGQERRNNAGHMRRGHAGPAIFHVNV